MDVEMKVLKPVEIDIINTTHKLEYEKWDREHANNHGVQKNADLKIDGLFAMGVHKFGFALIECPQ
jgi:hypothetical protein